MLPVLTWMVANTDKYKACKPKLSVVLRSVKRSPEPRGPALAFAVLVSATWSVGKGSCARGGEGGFRSAPFH